MFFWAPENASGRKGAARASNVKKHQIPYAKRPILSEKLENPTLFTTFSQQWLAGSALNKRNGLAGNNFFYSWRAWPDPDRKGSRRIQ